MKSSLCFGLLLASIGLASACGQAFVSSGPGGSATASGTAAGTGGATTGTTGATTGSGGAMAGTGGAKAGSSSAGVTTSASSGGGGKGGAGGAGGGGMDGGALGPTVKILHPGGDPRKKDMSIYFHGSATDPVDMNLSGSALVWSDSLEGQFGTGDPVNWAPSVVGVHVITLTGTDSLNYSAAATIMFKVIP